MTLTYDEMIFNKFSGPAVIFSFNGTDIKILKINNKYLPELGMNIDEDDFIGRDYLQCFDGPNKEEFILAVKRCIKSKDEATTDTWRKLFSHCCEDGSVYIHSRFVFVEGDEKESIIYETIKNVTPEMRTFEELSESERRYKLASEQINIYNWEYDIRTKEMRPCYRCMRDLGLPALVRNYPEPVIDMGIIPPDYADMYREMMKKVDSGVKEIEADIPLTVGRVPFRVRYTTEFGPNNEPIKSFASATLISEAELSKIKLDNNIIETLAEEYTSIYLADLNADKLEVIKQEGLFDIAKEGMNYQDIAHLIVPLITPESGKKAEKLLDETYVKKELFADGDRREFNYKDKENNRWVRINYHVVEKNNDSVSKVLIACAIIDDVRAQKMDSDRLIAVQKKELEERQELLIKAVDEANRANMAKTAFFSNMSHDIRTPMGAIIGFSKLAKDEIDNKENLLDYLDKIISASNHLLNLINDILDMSRIESGKMELTYSPSNVKALCLESADMIKDRMKEKNLEFTVDVNSLGEEIVQCDKLRVRQIILNLLSNAYKFTPEGGKVTFSAALAKMESDKYIYRLRIRDTGIGMSDEFKSKIWDAFSREENSTVNEIQGTGLGMSIVKNITDLMHGNIDFTTKLGEGSEFVVTLPLKISDAGTIASENSRKEESNDILNKRYDGKTILVVDDTAINRRLATIVLSKFGFRVMNTASGVDAVEIIKNSKPGDIDLILMDVEMPVMNGLEATKKIRDMEDKALSNIPIIAMTANVFESDVTAAKEAGMNEHVGKPFLAEELISKIDANLN